MTAIDWRESDNPTVQMPCVNRCVRTEDTDTPQLLRATHGHYCARCYYRTDGAVRRAGTLTEHIVTLVGGIQSKKTDGSQRLKKDPPLPFNVEAFADANEIYSRLVYWCSVWATRLNRPIPVPAARAWRNDKNQVVGLPNDITPQAVRYTVSIMAIWLSTHLDDILNTRVTDDVDYFRSEVDDIYRTAARWPMEDQAQYVPVSCWVTTEGELCGSKIALYPPKFGGDERMIVCDRGHAFEEDEYDHMASVFRQVRKEQTLEQIKAHKVAERLAKKYGAA